MSFEFYGGIIARDWLLSHGVDKELADSVAETIFRHTECVIFMSVFELVFDLRWECSFATGSLTLHVQVIQLATILGECYIASMLCG